MRTHDYTNLVETAEDWAETDRTLDDDLQVYGRPSAIFGDQDPHSAKTLGYASGDSTAPLAVSAVARFLGLANGVDHRSDAERQVPDSNGAFTRIGQAVNVFANFRSSVNASGVMSRAGPSGSFESRMATAS